MSIFALMVFASQVFVASGKLTVLRGKEDIGRYTHSRRKLFCVSEDDGSSLVWNSNLNWLYSSYAFTDSPEHAEFQSLNAYEARSVDCENIKCIDRWKILGWNITNAKLTPMGPVFDRQWEGFHELNNFEELDKYLFIDDLLTSGAFTVSIRGSSDAHMLFCTQNNFDSSWHNSPCLWIIIGGWSNTLSVIRKCANGVPQPPTLPTEPSCQEERASYKHEPLSSTEWRTFVITWNKNTGNISVYDTNRLLLTYVDDEDSPLIIGTKYKLYFRSHKPLLLRFHNYDFYHTTNSKAVLPSNLLYSPQPTDANFCMEMTISLCTDCIMNVVLKNSYTQKEKCVEIIRGPAVTAVHRLPTWQYVRINKTVASEFTANSASLQVKLITKISRATPKPWWSIKSLRQCPPTGSMRFNTMEATQDYDYRISDYFWPNVTCQKLFYNESIIVNSAPDATTNLELGDLHCPDGKVGPRCSVDCENDLQTSSECRESVICEEKGCTCPPGFIGQKCQSRCANGKYGQDCRQTCGSCTKESCNFKTGVCMSGCDNLKRHYIPPFCKIGIDRFPPPDIDFVNETIVHVSVPAKEEYKLILLYYYCMLENNGTAQYDPVEDAYRVYRNTTKLFAYFNNLLPGTTYNVYCELRIDNDSFTIPGQWNQFTTACTATTAFVVERQNTSLTLKKSEEKEASYPCPNEWYDISFSDHEREFMKGPLTKLPYQFEQLTPYALYKITVGKGAKVLFSQEVRTLDGVPSTVRNVNLMATSKRQLQLKWDPPEFTHGIIHNYKVVFQVQEYIGCFNMKMTSPQNETSLFTTFTNITLSDLTPYTNYVIKVSAYTSHPGPEIKNMYSTAQVDSPTAVYSNLRMQDYILMWDPPEDCTTISGPIIARIDIKGISKSVADFNVTKETVYYKIDLKDILYGIETYGARIYAIRGYNKQPNEVMYRKIIFTTPPKVPPPVRDLEIFETDYQTMDIHLRWKEPQPPHNGEIQNYVVSTCDYNLMYCETVFTVSPVEYCKLWTKYICAVVKELYSQYKRIIKVSAVNVNVSTPSAGKFVSVYQTIVPSEAPQSFIIKALERGAVSISWSHPWRTFGRLEKFSITAELITTNLRTPIQPSQRKIIHEYPIEEYRVQYDEQLYLLSSSTYRISVCGVTNANTYGEKKTAEVETPLAMAFEKELTTQVSNADSTISLRIPAVLNDTRNSWMHVVVKESQPCNQSAYLDPLLRKKAGIENDEHVWLATTLPTNEFVGKTLVIGDRKLRGESCPLKPGESYVIMVIVQTKEGSIGDRIVVAKTASIRIGEIPRRHEAWIIPVAILVLVVAAALYLYRRKKRGDPGGKKATTCDTENTQGNTTLPDTKRILLATIDSSDDGASPRKNTLDGGDVVVMNDTKSKLEESSLIKVNDFEDYVKQAIDSGLLDAQFNTLPRGQTKPWTYGRLPENKSKNRYQNLTAYDENRVVLKKLPDDPHSDYINADYIQGYKKEKCYIATQGPKANTVIDFWRMIWQEESHIVCMIANTVEGGKTKCEQYWPDIGKKKKYGEIVVYNMKHTVYADYTLRTLQLTHEDQIRKIEHLHYTAWPDHGVPLTTHSVVAYLKKLLATPPGNGPMVVHCSAGVGRTGTIILCDICLRRAAAEGVLDIFAEVRMIRSQRVNTVDTKQQYLFAHLVLVECLLTVSTSVPCNESLTSKINELKKQLPIQKQCLEKTTWQDEALQPPTSRASLSPCNLAKNRFPELASEKVSRVYLKRYPPTDEDSDYISAVYVDGLRLQNQYLATQLPLPATFSDFWRMVAEYKVELIIQLQPSDPDDPTCCPIVPCGEFKPVPYINVKTKNLVEFEHYTSQKLILVNNAEKPVAEQQVIILCSTEWKAGRNRDPPETTALVTLWQAAERVSRGDEPTVVLCHDGVTGCGLYLALSFLLNRMAVERECDVCLAIRAIRRSRPDFVQSLKHMEYLYDAAITYLRYFETYANFT